MAKKKTPTMRDMRGRQWVFGSMPRTDAVDPKVAVEALKEHIRYLEQLLVNATRASGKAAAGAHTAIDPEADREQLRNSLITEAGKMLPEALAKARTGKPALLRLLHRIAEPKSRS